MSVTATDLVRIAFTHSYCWPEVRRGAERFVPALAAALVRRGHDVVHYSAGWRAGRGIENGVETVRLRRLFKNDYRHEADFGRRVFPHLAAGRFDVVHSMGRHDAVASIRAARFHRSRRTVITDLGLPNPRYWSHISAHDVKAAQRVVDDIDIYSCMSRFAVECLESNYGRADGVVIPGGVDLAEFRPGASIERRPTILFSGAFEWRGKGVHTLLEALPLIAQDEPEVQLWLSGPGDPSVLLDSASSEARARTQCLGLGDAGQQHERYGRAWVTCLPSTNDSFGMALVESLACGTPLVTTTHAAPKELVEESVTGETCEPGDPEGLAAACIRGFSLARNPATAEACRASARAFDWDLSLAPLCEALYSEGSW